MAVNYKLFSPLGKSITTKKPNRCQEVQSSITPSIRCPHCMHIGTFSRAIQLDLVIDHVEKTNGGQVQTGSSIAGVRVCPNSDCGGVIFVVIGQDGRAKAFPNEVLDFDPENIPNLIAGTLEEAIKCHATQCYKAAALMVRRVLEELCEDRGARGGNLKERLQSLASIIVIPQELLSGADDLRLLGNDAAHIEAKTYDVIGEEEVRVAIDLTKELLKAAYQYKSLLARLASLKKATP